MAGHTTLPACMLFYPQVHGINMTTIPQSHPTTLLLPSQITLWGYCFRRILTMGDTCFWPSVQRYASLIGSLMNKVTESKCHGLTPVSSSAPHSCSLTPPTMGQRRESEG